MLMVLKHMYRHVAKQQMGISAFNVEMKVMYHGDLLLLINCGVPVAVTRCLML